MSTNLLATVNTGLGAFRVMTKDKVFFCFGTKPNTSILPTNLAEVGRYGVKIKWNTSEPGILTGLHNAILQIVGEPEGIDMIISLAENYRNLAKGQLLTKFDELTRQGLSEDLEAHLPSHHASNIKLITNHIEGIV